MKREILKELHFCDRCGKEIPFIRKCINCGRELCYECSEKEMNGYQERICFPGYDMYICKKCEENPNPKIIDILEAYRKVKELIDEDKKWHEDWKRRVEDAENNLKDVLKKGVEKIGGIE